MIKTGGCLCKGVQYEIDGPLRPVVGCHCTQCQKTSGNFVASTNAAVADITFVSSQTLTWYDSSDTAKRAFCNKCGGNLFWKLNSSQNMSIFAGTLDKPTNLQMVEHIYVEDKSDYYTISDGLPQRSSSDSNFCEF